MIGRGRRVIWTDEAQITPHNLISVLQSSMPYAAMIAKDCQFLFDYEKGAQPLQREKRYRNEIDCVCIDNLANEVTEFKLGFNWSSPITLVQRGDEPNGEGAKAEAVSMLNECYDAAGIREKTQELARHIEITGIGYTFVDINGEHEEGDSYFNLEVLDPRFAYVVRTTRTLDHRIVAGVTYRMDTQGYKHYTVFTHNERYEVNEGTITDRLINPLGKIPIVEWIRAHDRMGCFERQISEMDNLNLLISDFTNDVEQNTQAVWHANDIGFRDKEGKPLKPKDGSWLVTETSPDGRTPFVKPLAVEYDYSGMLANILSRRALILQKCNVPQRNDNSGGSTGVAMSDATGWSAAETAASKQQLITESRKMEEVKLALLAIKKHPGVPADSPILDLMPKDVRPNVKRQKTYELTVKTNAIATLLKQGFAGNHVIDNVPLFEDNNQVWADSREMVKKIQESLVKDAQAAGSDRLMADESDQITNSPMIDGMSKESPTAEVVE